MLGQYAAVACLCFQPRLLARAAWAVHTRLGIQKGFSTGQKSTPEPKLRLISFEVTPQQAGDEYLRYHSSSIWLAKPTPYKRLKEVLLPFWCFDVVVDVHVRSAQVGKNVLVSRFNPNTQQRETAWDTEWHSVHLNWAYTKYYDASGPDMQVYGSDKYTRSQVERMRPGAAVDACVVPEPRHMDARSGGEGAMRRTLAITMSPAEARGVVAARIRSNERADVERALLSHYNMDRVRFVDMGVTLRSVAAHPVLVPAYVFATMVRGLKLHTFVSGISAQAHPAASSSSRPSSHSSGHDSQQAHSASSSSSSAAADGPWGQHDPGSSSAGTGAGTGAGGWWGFAGGFPGFAAASSRAGGVSAAVSGIRVYDENKVGTAVALVMPVLVWVSGAAEQWSWQHYLWVGVVGPALAVAALTRAYPHLHFLAHSTTSAISRLTRAVWAGHTGAAGSSTDSSGSSGAAGTSGGSRRAAAGSGGGADDSDSTWWAFEWVRAYGQRPRDFSDDMHDREHPVSGGPHDPKGYYRLLDVTPQSSQQDIQAAYRSAVLKWHPDRELDINKKAHKTAIFVRLQEAYAVLRDPKKRAYYDRGRL